MWQQQLTVGELTSFAMYLSQLIWPMFSSGLGAIAARTRKGRMEPVAADIVRAAVGHD